MAAGDDWGYTGKRGIPYASWGIGISNSTKHKAEAEAKLAPHLERVPALLHELSAREVQVEESLRLHRERLRQVSEKNQKDVTTQMATTLREARRISEEMIRREEFDPA